MSGADGTRVPLSGAALAVLLAWDMPLASADDPTPEQLEKLRAEDWSLAWIVFEELDDLHEACWPGPNESELIAAYQMPADRFVFPGQVTSDELVAYYRQNVENYTTAGTRELLAAHHHGMSGAQLFRLLDEFDSRLMGECMRARLTLPRTPRRAALVTGPRRWRTPSSVRTVWKKVKGLVMR